MNIGKDAAPLLADKLMEMLANTNRQPETGGNLLTANRTREGYFYGRMFAVLAAMGTNAEAAMPALIAIDSSELPMDVEMEISGMSENRFGALAMVGRNHPDLIAPVLATKFVSSPAERGMIARAMTVFGTNQADAFLPVLLATVSDNSTDEYAGYTRTEIGVALSVIGHNQPDMVVPALLTIYTNCPLGWRVELARSLASFGGQARSAVPLLMADSLLANAPNDNRWRIDLAVAAKTIAPAMPDTLAPLFQDLKSSNAIIWHQTIQGLGRLGTNGIEAVPVLFTFLSNFKPQTTAEFLSPTHNQDNEVRNALRSIGVAPDDFLAALGNNLSSTNRDLSDKSRETLCLFAVHSKPAYLVLVKNGLSKSMSSDVRELVKSNLMNLSRFDPGRRDNNPKFLIECLNEPDAEVRSEALMVLREWTWGRSRADSKLRQMATDDPDADVRSQAADVLRLQRH